MGGGTEHPLLYPPSRLSLAGAQTAEDPRFDRSCGELRLNPLAEPRVSVSCARAHCRYLKAQFEAATLDKAKSLSKRETKMLRIQRAQEARPRRLELAPHPHPARARGGALAASVGQ